MAPKKKYVNFSAITYLFVKNIKCKCKLFYLIQFLIIIGIISQMNDQMDIEEDELTEHILLEFPEYNGTNLLHECKNYKLIVRKVHF